MAVAAGVSSFLPSLPSCFIPQNRNAEKKSPKNGFPSIIIIIIMTIIFVVVVVAVSAVLRMRDSRATTFGSRCFNKLVTFRFVSDFRGLFCTPAHARSALRSDW